ncbi:MAG TPA: EAL domain-containing protein [Phenylobacterium sp.]|nr:EAL domain-containing protein [Phenylobacterium sp.]
MIAEGVESQGELAALREMGVRYIQGYLLARPAFQALPLVSLPAPAARAASA